MDEPLDHISPLICVSETGKRIKQKEMNSFDRFEVYAAKREDH